MQTPCTVLVRRAFGVLSAAFAITFKTRGEGRQGPLGGRMCGLFGGSEVAGHGVSERRGRASVTSQDAPKGGIANASEQRRARGRGAQRGQLGPAQHAITACPTPRHHPGTTGCLLPWHRPGGASGPSPPSRPHPGNGWSRRSPWGIRPPTWGGSATWPFRNRAPGVPLAAHVSASPERLCPLLARPKAAQAAGETPGEAACPRREKVSPRCP